MNYAMNYTNQILNNVGVHDVLSSKEEKIHNELFNNALSKFKLANNYSDDEYSFIEYRVSNDYLQPSNIVVVSKIFPYTRTSYNLSKYWDNYEFTKKYDRIDNEDESLEIIEMFYTSGKALIKNKYTGEEFTLDFNKCTNIPFSEDWFRFRGELDSKSTVVK